MKKILAVILTALLCILPLAACEKKDPVRDDLLNYLNNQFPAIAEQDSTVYAAYVAAIQAKDATNETLAAAFGDTIIPGMEALIEAAKTVAPATSEVAELHAVYVESLTVKLEGYNLILQAAKENSNDILASANEKIQASNTAEDQYYSSLEELKDAHNVTDKDIISKSSSESSSSL